MNTGPTNSSALLTSAVLLSLTNHHDPLATAFQLTILVGILRMAMGLFRLGWTVRFVPESSFLGFAVGAGVLIALGQIHHLLGVSASKHPWFVMRMADVIRSAPHANPYAVGIGWGTLAIMFATQRLPRRWPVALLAIAGATLVAWALGDQAGVRLVRDIAPVPWELPLFAMHAPDAGLLGCWANSIDYSCWNALFDFAEVFHRQGGKLYLCGVRPDFERLISEAGVDEMIPSSQVFPSQQAPFHAFETAVRLVLHELPPGASLSPAWRARAELGSDR